MFAGANELTSPSAVVVAITTMRVTCVAVPTDLGAVATTATPIKYKGEQFTTEWKAPPTAGNCYRVTVTSQDGSTLSAYFTTK